MASTFVFLDLETTGLEDDCKITEMCLCAVSRNALLKRPFTAARFPRVLDKLALCFNPARVVSPKAEELSGLSLQLLFDNNRGVFSQGVAEFLKSFLKMQAPPVCLVAHYGYNFDFRKLANHFRDVGVELSAAEMGLRCVDTVKAFQALKPKPSTENFKLGTLYSKYVGGNVQNAHTAEGDCLSLLELVYRTADEVVPWADVNAMGFTHDY